VQTSRKAYWAIVMAFASFLFVLVPIAVGAGSITLSPTVQAPGAAVSVSGSGFGGTKTVGFGVGTEVAGNNTNMAYSGTGTGPFLGRVSNWPIKPGSFVLTADATSGGGATTTYTDNGDGTLQGPGGGGTINYITGQWSRNSPIDLTGITIAFSAIYTRYQYNVTPAAGVTTSAAGAFNATITVPAVANGNYTVTAVDSQGNRAVATLNVNSTIPEVLPSGLIILLSAAAVIVSSRYFRRKQPLIEN
jgi:hypothetical protein